jgi:hypothetical protein
MIPSFSKWSGGAARDKLTFSKGPERVSRSGKFSQKFVFARKLARESTFLSKGFNFKDSWIVLSILRPLTAKTSWVTVPYSKYYTSLNVPKKTLHFDCWKNYFKLFYVLETCFVLNFKYCWKFLAFLLVDIQLFSAQKQMSFRRRIFEALRIMAAIMSCFKDGGQVIVIVLLEFTGLNWILFWW